ncbi:MAG TPA: hypothetical protein VJJ53_03105 [Candidatus Nanoarchaeia archaeon]|nr:hypothetical protein [Candidatus Nanoarchaeia archaeon]
MAKKLLLDVDEDLWKQVSHFKIDCGAKNYNEAVVELIKRGLKKR